MSQLVQQHPAAFAGALKNNIFVQHPGDEGLRRRRVGRGTNNIFVRRSGGEDITLEFDRLETVADVKDMIYEKECIHPTLQRLMFGRRLLSNDRNLAYYKIDKGSTIHLLKNDFGDGKGKNNIVVRMLTGDTIRLNVDLRETTVAYVRGMIAEKAGIYQVQQHLVFRGRLQDEERILDDSNTLAHYGIKENSYLNLVPGRRGGGSPPEMGIIAAHHREPMPPNGLRGYRVEGKTKIVVRMVMMDRSFLLELDLFKTIADVKYIIYEKEGIRPDQQYIEFNTQQLDDDDRTLADYNIRYGSSLVLHLHSSAKFDIFVKKITGEILKVNVDFKRTIFRAMNSIHCGKVNIHWTRDHLVFEGQPLDNHLTLADYNIQPESTLHLALGPSAVRNQPEMEITTYPDGLCHRHHVSGDKIYIRRMTGLTLPLELDLSKTIADVKDMIAEMEGIPTDQQRFVFEGNQLASHCTLEDYNIQNGSTIHLIIRLRGGGGTIILVQKLTGEIFKLGVSYNHTISQIRDMINEEEGIHRTQQHLVLDGSPLDDNFTLKDYNIQNGSTLHLALVPLGASSSPEEDVETRMDDSSTDEDEEENELESSEESAKKLFAELFTDEDDEDTDLDSNDEEFAEKLFAEVFADEDEEENELESSEESIEKDEYGLVQTEQPWAHDHGHDQLSSDTRWALVAVNEAIGEQEGVTGEMQVQLSENIHVNVHGIGALADQVEQKRKRWYKYSLKNVVFAISILATYLGSASTSFSIGKLAFKITIGAAFIADAALSILMPPKWGDALVYLSWFLVVLVSYLLLVSFNKYYVYAILPVPLPIVVALLFQLRRFAMIMKKISTYLIKMMDQLKLMQRRRLGNEAVQNADLERANNQDQGTNNDEDDQHFDRIFELSGDIVNCGGIITVIFGNSLMVGPASALGFLFFYTIALGLYLMMVTTVRHAALTPHVLFLAILLKVLLVITLITSLIHGVF